MTIDFLQKNLDKMKSVAYEQGYQDKKNGDQDADKVRADLNKKIPIKYRIALKQLNIDIETEIFDKVVKAYNMGIKLAEDEELEE